MKKLLTIVFANLLLLRATAQTGFDDYIFTPPQNWQEQKTKDFIFLSQSQDPASGCVAQILLPAASSGDLEKDAKAVFAMMYPGWEYRNSGDKQYDLTKGNTAQGLPFCMMEAAVKKVRADGYYYDYEDGSALVIGVGKQIVIIASRHERLTSCECRRNYILWKRFFNSFTVKNAVPPQHTEEDASTKIIGVWKTAESMSVSDYVFAANGHYQHGGALATSSTSRDQYYEYLHIKSYSFEGDGTWAILKNELTLTKRGEKEGEKRIVRFEQVNHGGTGWKDRMVLLQKDAAGEYEVRYEKQLPAKKSGDE